MNRFRTVLLALVLPLLIAANVPFHRQLATKPIASTTSSKPKPVSKTAPVSPIGLAEKIYPLQSITFAHGVTMTQLVYRTLPGFRPLTLDLYRTSLKGYPRPGLVFIHGGNWNSGDTRHAGTFGDFPSVLASLAARGLVVASIEYRLSGEARFPAALQDVKSAIRWLRVHKSDFNLDDTRIAAWGTDAGGQLAALAGVSCGVTTLEPENDPLPSDSKDKPPSDCLEAVVDWYGVTDLETQFSDLGKTTPDKTAAGDYLGCEPALCPVDVAHNASPLAYIEAMSPPFLIQHGAEDSEVSPQQSQKLYDALKTKNVPVQLVIYPGAGHDFAPAPESPDPTAGIKALEKLEAFLDESFPKKPASSPYKPPKHKGLPY